MSDHTKRLVTDWMMFADLGILLVALLGMTIFFLLNLIKTLFND